MKKYFIFIAFVFSPIIGILLLTRYWIIKKLNPDYGTMLILSITFLALIAYTYINYLFLKAPFKPYGTLILKNNDQKIGDLRVIVSNKCLIPLKAKLFLNPTVYGKPVKLSPEFATYFGKKYWELAPEIGIDGHIEVKNILEAAGKSIQEMENKYSDDIANQQLRVEAEVIFIDYHDKYNKFNPKIKQKMVYNFNRKVWIYEV